MSDLKLQYKKVYSCEVLVAGGGTAGVAAAVSAARNGAKVTLIEKSTFLGGMATGALVTPMMKNATNPKNILTKGLFLEVCERLSKAGGGNTFKDGNPGWFNPEIYKCVLDEMCTEAGINLIFDSQIIDVQKSSNYLESIFFLTKGGVYSIEAKEFIDTTGDGDLISFSSVSFEEGSDENRQAMSLRFMMSNVDLEAFAKYLKEHDTSGDSPVYEPGGEEILLSTAFTFERDWTLKPIFEEAIKCRDISKEDASYFQLFSIPGSKGLVAFNCPRVMPESKPLSPLSFNDTSTVLIKGRSMILRISEFCKKYLPGFKDSYISQIAPHIGIRESRRLKGQYTLTAEDVVNGKKFNDSIGDSNWPIDVHPSSANSKATPMRHPPKGDFYQIPLRSLLPVETECKNLIVAGRNLSADFEAQGSARIQPNCWAMGEAAGKLAATRIKDKH